jgi:hypothetical protein
MKRAAGPAAAAAAAPPSSSTSSAPPLLPRLGDSPPPLSFAIRDFVIRPQRTEGRRWGQLLLTYCRELFLLLTFILAVAALVRSGSFLFFFLLVPEVD